jgi:hypothetical protein
MTPDILTATVPESGWPAEFPRNRRSTGARIAADEAFVDIGDPAVSRVLF